MKPTLRSTIYSTAAVALLFFANSCGQQQAQMPSPTYKTMVVELSNQTILSSYSAAIKGKQNVEIRPQVSGLITQICINEGAQVRKGQLLFVIEQAPYKAAVETAQANVENAQAKLANAQLVESSQAELFKAGVVADFDMQKAHNSTAEAHAALSQTKAQLSKAQTDLSYTEVRCPVDGVASMIPYRVGALVSSAISEPLVTVSDQNKMYAYFSMTESQTLNLTRQSGSLDEAIKQMPAVELRLVDGSPYKHSGRIDAISGTVDENTGAVTMRAEFDNPENMLRNGGAAKVVIPTIRENCISIPQSATYELQNRVFVYKVVDGKAKSTPVEILAVNNGVEYIVTSGLEVGDVIIADGAGLVREGAVVNSAPAAVAATDSTAKEKSEKQ